MTDVDVYGPVGAATITGPEAPRVRRRKPWTARRAITWGVMVLALVVFVVWARARIDGLSEDTQAANPVMRWEWLFLRDSTPGELREALTEHLKLTIIPVALGLVIASLLSALAIRFRWTFTPITAIAGFLYTIPSIALFGALGSRYTYFTAAVVALTSYTLLILIRNIVAGIDAVPASVTDAADGLGLSRRRRLVSVELPLALPVIIAGLRVATVTTIGLVAITGVIQLGGFGALVLDGYQNEFYTRIAVGSVASIALAVAFDLGLNRLEIVLTPWLRRRAR
jgi:osmoprotectant transport system permease protein